MRRADRLFQIVQVMRRRPTATARDIAAELEVSERTIYRDIRDLAASGVPIEGAAGIGYVLRPGFDMPPLMFREQEIEALVLGARIIESWGDTELAAAASDVIAKVEAVIPERLRGYMAQTALMAPPTHYGEPLRFDLAELRRALRSRLRVRFAYVDVYERPSDREVRPLSLAFFGPVWILAAWCEMREEFRTFRLDRMSEFAVSDPPPFRSEPGKTLQDFLKRPGTWTRTASPPTGAA